MKFRQLLKNPDAVMWLMLAAWWVVNLVQAAFTGLADDEAYYYMFSQHLAWGYFDHPPFTALLVKLGGFLCGQGAQGGACGELGVRFFFTLLQPLYIWFFWQVIKPALYDTKDVVRYVLICAAMPILQLYGIIAVPDGPLMFFTALFLWTYRRFTTDNRCLSALLMGFTIGALAYSKYHGALVVLLAVASNIKLLRNPKFYVACLVAFAAMLPHLYWQQQNDWVSFSYHLAGRNRDFQLSFVTEYLLNLLAIFNPLLFPIAIVAWWKIRSTTPIQRAISAIGAGFILFFLASTLRGYVQPQWEIPATFTVIALLYAYTTERAKLKRYVLRASWITLALMALVRIEMIFNPIGLKFQIFNNEESYAELAEIADGRPVIFDGGYTEAAKYLFYTGGETYAQPTVNRRTSHYELMDDDTKMAGRSVVVERKYDVALPGIAGDLGDGDNSTAATPASTPASAASSGAAPSGSASALPASHSPSDAATSVRRATLANGYEFNYIVIDRFIPVRKLRIDTDLTSREVRAGDRITAKVTIHNPYPYRYQFDGKTTTLNIVWRRVGEPVQVYPLTSFTGTLEPAAAQPATLGSAPAAAQPAAAATAPNPVLQGEVTFTVPDISRREYQVGFIVNNGAGNTWFNSEPVKITITD